MEIPEAMIGQLAEFMEFHTEARYPDAKMYFYRNAPRNTKEKFKEIKEVYS